LDIIFRKLYVTPIDPPLTSKKKDVDKKNLVAPYGAIISLQKGTLFRGIITSKRKKHWCSPNCQLYKDEKRKKKDNTVIEVITKIEGTDYSRKEFYCTNCKTYYPIKKLKKITNFLNQLTIVLSLGDININIMMFTPNYKIAGCKKDSHATEASLVLWEDYIRNIPESWTMNPRFNDIHPKFSFSLVMQNRDFKFGFDIDRGKLNNLMNSPKYADKVHMSQCEKTAHTSVNIKMHAEEPEDYTYDCLVIPAEDTNIEPYFITLDNNIYRTIKKDKEKFTTLIVFSSSETIQSGRYDVHMKEMYEFFIKEVMENKKQIEEVIEKPKEDLLTYLKNFES
jgi:hypothetical protein